MPDDAITPCEYARLRHQNLVMWRDPWTILLFVFGASVIVFLSLAVVLFIRSAWLPGALTTLGTIVDSAGIKWVLNRRREAVREEEAAYRDVSDKCDNTREADELREQHMLFGRIR